VTHPRGTVVVATDPFGQTPRRPYLVLSDDDRPFAGEQYIALGISTKEYDESFPIEGSFERGELSRPSFVSPWAAVPLSATNVDRSVARLTPSFTDECSDRLVEYV
jgi:hypothetical protein